eukprot:TRINITY_DN2528_c0_g1_i1.p1 TRINITY_DN2528_c0_g1~~TRINITY_DN2528_c0_g1_i1.p1  ORF type:complete len:497 (+),score=55.70 TRINITY_DN2528_c0_g1_i1:502-1992(+)
METTNIFVPFATDTSASGAVYPRRDCPHVDRIQQPSGNIDLSASCAGCQATGENWACLTCYQVNCSRYVNGHNLAHFQATGHPICLSFSDLSFWCHECQDYIVADILTPVYLAAHINKFGVEPGAPGTVEEIASVRAVMGSDSDPEDTDSDTEPEPDNTDPPAACTRSRTQASQGFVPVRGLQPQHHEPPLIDKILGCIYGNALGDAYGLATEFQTKDEVLKIYGNREVPFPNYKRNYHNSRWTAGDWTDDTDQMILIMETLVECGGPNAKVFAAKLDRWIRKGFPELGDFAGMGLGMTVSKVVHHRAFKTDPHRAATEVWEKLNRNAAANGAIMRTSVLGCFQFEDLQRVVENTLEICKVTHVDTRCQASCVLVTTLISLILQGAPANTSKEQKVLIGRALEAASKLIAPEHAESLNKHIIFDDSQATLEALELDEDEAIGFTFKCMASGLYGFCSSRPFKATLNSLIREGGDADTNGAVCGALLGCRLGYKQVR